MLNNVLILCVGVQGLDSELFDLPLPALTGNKLYTGTYACKDSCGKLVWSQTPARQNAGIGR